MFVRRGIAAALTTCALLAVPAAAQAADYYVDPAGSDANPCSQASPCATIGHAVGLPAVVNDDTIHLAAGTYPESININKRLNFIGAGPGTSGSAAGSSFVHPTSSGPAFELQNGGSLQNLRARGNDGNGVSAGAVILTPFSAGTYNYSVQNVIAIGGQDTTAGTSETAISASAGLPTSHVFVDIGNSTATSGLTDGNATYFQVTSGSLAATVHGSTLSPAPSGAGILSFGGAALTLADSTVKRDTGTIGIDASGPTTISHSTVNGANFGIIWGGGTPFSLVDSLVVAKPTSNGTQSVDLDAIVAGPATAKIQGSTIVTETSGNNQDGLAITSQAGSSIDASLVNSVVRVRKLDGTASNGDDITTTLNTPGGAINLTASHSNYSTIDAGTGTTIPAAGAGTNITGNPGFSSFSGEKFTLATDSALTDRGDPAVVTPGETDLVGAGRNLDGNTDCVSAPDPGAYELAGQEGGAPNVGIAGPTLARRNQDVTFSTLPHQGISYSWTFSDGGSATGDTVHHKFSKDGAQTASLTATQAFCVGTVTRNIRIDGTPPKIKGISVKHRNLSFHVSESAKSTVTFLRRNARGKYKSTGKLSITAHRGTNTKRLPRKLDGHKLRSGKYLLKVRATDQAGNHSRVTTAKLKIWAPRR